MFEQSGIRFFCTLSKAIFVLCSFPCTFMKNKLMKNLLIKALIPASLFLLWNCKEKSHEHGMHDHHHDSSAIVEVSPNKILYDKVMDIHDEVMPKMQDLHNREQALKKN